MKILVTGGTGFIGSRLALRCLERGDAVRVFGRVNNPDERETRRRLEESGAEVVPGSITDRELVAEIAGGMEVVFHLAAAQHEANIPDRAFWDVNVEGTRNMLEASVACGVRRFVHGSTIGVYGSLEGPIDEGSPLNPDNIYGVTKLEGERLALSFAKRLPVVVVRITETYGPGDRRLLKLFRGIQRGLFFMIGEGSNLHHPIYIDDLVEGLLLASESERAPGEVFLLAGKQALSTREMVSTIAGVLGAGMPRLRIPLAPLMLLATALEKTLGPLGVQPPLHRRRMDFFKKSFSLSGGKASAVLGFEPKVSFQRGAAQTAGWYRESGLL